MGYTSRYFRTITSFLIVESGTLYMVRCALTSWIEPGRPKFDNFEWSIALQKLWDCACSNKMDKFRFIFIIIHSFHIIQGLNIFCRNLFTIFNSFYFNLLLSIFIYFSISITLFIHTPLHLLLSYCGERQSSILQQNHEK